MSERKAQIEQVANGYVFTSYRFPSGEREVFRTLDEVFARLLGYCEGRVSCGGPACYGRVIVLREKPAEEPAGDFQEILAAKADRVAQTHCARCGKPIGETFEEYGRDGAYWGKYHPICLQMVRSGKGAGKP